MSFVRISICTLLIAACTLVMAQQVSAQSHCATPRQYYSDWKKHPSQDYHYRNYYYKPKESYSGYKHHYVVYSPKKPKHLYYYNPYKKQYWGRCHAGYKENYSGKPMYSHLAPEHRKATLDVIDESSFPDFGALPPIPDSSDGVLIDLPPDDLPIIAPGGF